MSSVEKTRYDRQIRLWGKSFQQQLMSTHVLMRGIQGEAAEVAKNLLLAGVRSISIDDSGSCTSDDMDNNFLLQRGRGAQTRAEVAVECLHTLNPDVWVSVMASVDAKFSASAHVVVVSQVSSASAMKRNLADHNKGRVCVLLAGFGDYVLSLFLQGSDRQSMEVQLSELLDDPAKTSTRPLGFQKVLLFLHVMSAYQDGAPGAVDAAMVLRAAEVVEQLRLSNLSHTDVQEVLDNVVATAPVSAVAATVAGAAAAQNIIHLVGGGGSGPAPHLWALCSAAEQVEVSVGGI